MRRGISGPAGALLATLLAVGLAASSLASGGSLTGTVKCVGVKNSADAVVYVDSIPGKVFPPPKDHVQIDQKGMVFIPHVLPVLVGTTVDFLNSDPFLHNVFTPDKCAEKFNLGSWPQGHVRSYTFKKPCVATLLCNVHPEMEAFAVAVSTPYFAVTDPQGAYVIKDVPDGAYTVRVWHPKLKEAVQPVTVAGETVVNFEIKK
jgi:plastocyanin